MQSYIQVDKEYLHTLKINCKGKRTVEKANKRINIEKIILDLKFLKIKIKKKKKTEQRRRRRKTPQLRRTAKAKIEAEVYNSNKKCDWEKKKKNSKA